MLTTHRPPAILKLLSHEVRWQIVAALAQSDRRGQELVRLLHRPQNLISYHLKRLVTHKLVTDRQSSADGRDVYFSLRLDQVRQLLFSSGQALHPGIADTDSDVQTIQPIAGLPQVRVIFLCT